MPTSRSAFRALIIIGGLFLAMQLVPYGRHHSNPAERTEPQWNSVETRALAQRACFDCHSNETQWPWYSSVAPASWLVQHDVDEGRQHVNFSEFRGDQRRASRAAHEVSQGEMPPSYYLPLHPEARLTEAEKQQLIAGLQATFPEQPKH